MEKKKLKITDLKVNSFVTSIKQNEQLTILGMEDAHYNQQEEMTDDLAIAPTATVLLRQCSVFACFPPSERPDMRREIPREMVSVVVCSFPPFCSGLGCSIA